jgi:alpha-1,2-mannosyltransferase
VVAAGGNAVSRRVFDIAVAGAALLLDPPVKTILLGQVNLVLLLLVVADLSRPDGARGKGLGVGVAAGIKLLPALFAVYLLLTGRVRAALVAAGAFALTVVTGYVFAPVSSLAYWGGLFLQTDRVGFPQNPNSQSLASLVARWLHSTSVEPAWLGVEAATAAAVLSLAVWAHRKGDELLAICVCGIGTLLLSPITWQHHWVWVIPMLVWLGARARAGHIGAIVLTALVAIDFFARPYRFLPIDRAADLRLDLGQLLLGSTYAAAAIAFLVAATVALSRGRARGRV